MRHSQSNISARLAPVVRAPQAAANPNRHKRSRTFCLSRFRSAMSCNEINVPKLEMKRQVSLWRHRASVQRHRKSRHSPCDTAMGQCGQSERSLHMREGLLSWCNSRAGCLGRCYLARQFRSQSFGANPTVVHKGFRAEQNKEAFHINQDVTLF